MFGGWLDIGKKVVYLAGAVVDEAHHGNIDGHLLIWGGEVGTMASSFMDFEEYTADYSPYDGRVRAALPRSVNWEEFTVRIVFVGYAKNRFKFIFGFFEGPSMDKDDVAV